MKKSIRFNTCFCGKERCNEHRESKTPFYKRWAHIRSRCTFKWDKDYKRYGAKGIRFEWETYQEFKKDMYPLFVEHVEKFGEKNTTLDRIDFRGNYSKENCRWATIAQQNLNRSSNRFLTISGVTKTYVEWSRDIGCSRQALRYRIKAGMDPELILKTPFKHSNRYQK